MQVKATTNHRIPAVSVECDPAEFDGMLYGPKAVLVAPQMPLSLAELVTALLMNVDLTTEILTDMDDDAVRHEVAFSLLFSGLSGVQSAVVEHLHRKPVDAVEAKHRKLCEVRVKAAFGLAAPSRSRVGDAVARQRRIVVRAA